MVSGTRVQNGIDNSPPSVPLCATSGDFVAAFEITRQFVVIKGIFVDGVIHNVIMR